LLRSSKLASLHFDGRLGDFHLLAVIGIIQSRDDGAGFDPLSLIEGKFDDARLDSFEAEYALVRFDIAGDKDCANLRR
jgi:hypothetical protein